MPYVKYAAVPAAALLLFLFFFITERDTEPMALPPIEATPQTALETSEQQPIETEPPPQNVTVDVKGAVHYPGVYTFTAEQRIVDAIEAAGGYVDDADSTLINHAQKLADELIIYVPRHGEEMPTLPISSTTTTNSSSDTSLININTATEQQLQELPGIGPAKAAAIVAHRQEHGAFSTTDGLKEVSGIGDKSFEQLSDLITVK